MAIKVYGSVFSTPGMRVSAALYEKELEFEFVPVEIATREHKTESYLSLNPFGLIPAFEDGDLKLFESRAISQYIAHNYADKGNQLIYQDDPRKMANMYLWMEIEAHQFDPVAAKLSWELGVKPLFDMAIDEAVVEESEVKLAKVLDIYEARLAQSKYLAGDRFTLADLHHLPHLQYLVGTKIQKLFDSRPNVRAWCDEIMARPATRKVLAMRKNN